MNLSTFLLTTYQSGCPVGGLEAAVQLGRWWLMPLSVGRATFPVAAPKLCD